MRLLGIDWGRKKCGLALAEAGLAVPWRILRYHDTKILSEKIKKIVQEERIKKIVIGVSENAMAEETKEFGAALAGEIAVPVDYSDETLTTQEAVVKAAEAGVPLKKRQEMEDAFAATLMLQNYLDSH